MTDTELFNALESWRSRGGYICMGSEHGESGTAQTGPWTQFSCELSGIEGVEGQYREAETIRGAIEVALKAVGPQ